MTRSIRGRLDLLEKRHDDTGAYKLPPNFWDAICGAVPVEQLDPDSRRLVEWLFEDSRGASVATEDSPR